MKKPDAFEQEILAAYEKGELKSTSPSKDKLAKFKAAASATFLKEKRIKLLAKPLGRPPAVSIHLSPGERNPIEGKFGQAKTGYGLNRIRARLKGTSETWIASIILVLNLVKLAGLGVLSLLGRMVGSFSAILILSTWMNLRKYIIQ